MWIFLNDAFLSIVAHKDRPGSLLVRARRREDIARVFSDAVVEHSSEADYAFRAVLPREVVAATIANRLLHTDYTNFKNSIRDPIYHNTCFSVWHIMLTYQQQMESKNAKAQE